MIRYDIFQEFEPKRRQRGEYRSFERNRVWQHDIESRYAISDYYQQLVFDRINISNFSTSEKLDTMYISFYDSVNERASSIGLSFN